MLTLKLYSDRHSDMSVVSDWWTDLSLRLHGSISLSPGGRESE